MRVTTDRAMKASHERYGTLKLNTLPMLSST
jgi:hypothetical protein